MGGFLVPIIRILIALIDLYWWVVIIAAVVSWLIAFGVINTHNRAVARLVDFLYRATEPALRPIQRILPNFGGIDISPVILLLILWFIEMELVQFEVSLLLPGGP
jgi:YggT family protein